MQYITYFGTALALAMDAFSVSISYGSQGRKLNKYHFLLIALFFGFFQWAMPVLGWVGSSRFAGMIDKWDHWIAFGLLAIIGGKMIYDFFQPEEHEDTGGEKFSYKKLIILSFATSIDALAVGAGYGIISYEIWIPSMIIGLVTFVLCLVGVRAGYLFHYILGKKTEFFGGLVLILIGLKIVLEHILFNSQ